MSWLLSPWVLDRMHRKARLCWLVAHQEPQKELTVRQGMVAHTCNPSILRGQGGRIAWAQELEISLGNMAKTGLYQKYKN